MIEILAFLAIWWYPIVMVALMSLLIWYVTRPESSEMILARQKADYERAHAYTEGKCHE